jgi:uncharacterized protein YaaN involved in tellurite resistance
MPPKPLNLGKAPSAPPVVAETPQPSYAPALTPAYNPPAVQTPSYQPSGRAVVLTLDETSKAGQKTQMAIAEATKKITSIAKTSDMDDLGALLSETLAKAKGYDMAGQTGGGLFGFFKRKTEEIRARFEKVDSSVNRLVGQIDQRVNLFNGRVNDLGSIAIQNKSYHDSLTGEIEHLNEGVAYMEANVPVADPNDQFSAQKVQEWHTVVAWARKRADDLRRAQIVATQQDAQITLMQQNSRALAQKFTDLKVTTLPLLQQTFTLYIINMEQAKGAEFATSIDDLTEATLQKNAAQLGQNTVAVHTALNRSNFSMDAIMANKDAVIKALDDIDRIRSETKSRLADEAPKLEQASRDLAARLAQAPTI